ncbi:MAG: PD-(D/E)XK nuclease family protein, partial [Lachnospiraceae bacterium]|nr:PD-(D/E)XK nuclease family protein [Lachnospiraceae bacterium]
VEAKEELSPEEINDRILTQLRMNGVVNGEPDIIEKIDAYMGSKSRVVPVEKKKDGTFSSRSDIMSTGELQIVSDYVGKKVADLGRGILSGRITMDPYERKGQDACTYCAYKKVCGFDTAVPGYEKRTLAEMEDGDILKGMETYGD